VGVIRDGIPASPGIVIGPAYVLRWEQPRAPHVTLPPERVEAEIAAFQEARHWAQERIRLIQRETAERLGGIEAGIFEPQILLLEDPDFVRGTEEYIRENRLSAARAFELRMLELHSDFARSGHPMMMDRLNDLLDVELRVLRRLLNQPDPDFTLADAPGRVILVARDLTPTITVQLDRNSIVGIATDAGTRTSHSSILARSLNLPAVVSLGDLSTRVSTGQRLILDGRSGRVIIDPDEEEERVYRERDVKMREWETELMALAQVDAVTPDHQPILVRANIDLPTEAEAARTHGAQGVGLFRTEFLVVGRSAVPAEEEQFNAYRHVAEVFAGEAVYIRTFDLGGDKFPMFLNMPAEENPFLGWRAIRVCLDTPDLFRPQIRALLRATAFGDVRIMLPLVNDVEEVRRTRDMFEEEADSLRADGIAFNSAWKLGVMIETPASALTASELARHADFFSIGSNDLVQYTLAVDRGNSRLAPLYTPFHPAVIRLLDVTARAGRAAGIEVSVCGEMASNPLAVFLLIGLGITALSVPAVEAREAVHEALVAPTPEAVVQALSTGLARWLDLSLFSGRWNLSPGA